MGAHQRLERFRGLAKLSDQLPHPPCTKLLEEPGLCLLPVSIRSRELSVSGRSEGDFTDPAIFCGVHPYEALAFQGFEISRQGGPVHDDRSGQFFHADRLQLSDGRQNVELCDPQPGRAERIVVDLSRRAFGFPQCVHRTCLRDAIRLFQVEVSHSGVYTLC